MRRLDSGYLDRKNGIDIAGTLQQRSTASPEEFEIISPGEVKWQSDSSPQRLSRSFLVRTSTPSL
jgi:hypothetical protein